MKFGFNRPSYFRKKINVDKLQNLSYLEQVRDRACALVRRDNPRALARGLLTVQAGAQTMLYLTCTMISTVDLAHYGVSRAKGWVSVDCGTKIRE